jgi:uncharacterized protein
MSPPASLIDALLRLPQQALILLVRAYRLLLKPWVGNACRFEPSCSAYALEALQRHGALAGSALSSWRLLRCHPWCDGGCDPVPATFAPHQTVRGLFTRWTTAEPSSVATPPQSTPPSTADADRPSAGLAAGDTPPGLPGGARSRCIEAPPSASAGPTPDRPAHPVLDRSRVTPLP